MNDDMRELLTLLVRAGEIAGRALAKDELVQSVKADPPVAAAEPPPPPASVPVQLPANFRIGRGVFEDYAPTQKKWFTPHAVETLAQRYSVASSVVYKTLQHVYRLIRFGGAEALYTKDSGKVWAVHIFGRPALAVTDRDGERIITFLPPEAMEVNTEIIHHPDVKMRLRRYIEHIPPSTVPTRERRAPAA